MRFDRSTAAVEYSFGFSMTGIEWVLPLFPGVSFSLKDCISTRPCSSYRRALIVSYTVVRANSFTSRFRGPFLEVSDFGESVLWDFSMSDCARSSNARAFLVLEQMTWDCAILTHLKRSVDLTVHKDFGELL
jgi:hypothetical protein